MARAKYYKLHKQPLTQNRAAPQGKQPQLSCPPATWCAIHSYEQQQQQQQLQMLLQQRQQSAPLRPPWHGAQVNGGGAWGGRMGGMGGWQGWGY